MRRAFLLTFISLALAGAAGAQPRPGPPHATPAAQEIRQACANDAQTFCAGTQERERSLCLLSHLDKVSPACKDALGTPTPARPAQPAPQPPPPRSGEPR